jgi:hypothetical protein
MTIQAKRQLYTSEDSLRHRVFWRLGSNEELHSGARAGVKEGVRGRLGPGGEEKARALTPDRGIPRVFRP